MWNEQKHTNAYSVGMFQQTMMPTSVNRRKCNHRLSSKKKLIDIGSMSESNVVNGGKHNPSSAWIALAVPKMFTAIELFHSSVSQDVIRQGTLKARVE